MRQLHSAHQEITLRHRLKACQRSLNSVKHLRNQPRSQFDRQRTLRRFHRLSWSKPRGFFIYLNGGLISTHLNDFPNQAQIAHTTNILNIRFLHPRGDHQRTRNFYNLSLTHNLPPFFGRFLLIFYPCRELEIFLSYLYSKN